MRQYLRLRCLLLIGIFFGVSSVYAQEKVFKVLLLPPVDVSSIDESRVFRDPLFETVERQIRERKFEIISREIMQALPEYSSLVQEPFLPADRVVPLGRSVGADVVVTTIYGLEGKRMYIHIKGFDVRTSRLAAAVAETGFAQLAGFSLGETAARRFAEDLVRYREQYDPNELITLEAIAGLTFLSEEEGMQISIDKREPIGTIEGGELEAPYVPFRVGTTIQVWKEKEGYYPIQEEVTLQEGFNRVQLAPLPKKYKNEVSAAWTLGESWGSGIEYRRYFEPDWFFVSFTGRFYIQYDTYEGSSPVFHNDISFSLGEYFFLPYDSWFRVGCSLGVGVVVTSFTESEMPVYTDYYLNILSPFLDLNFRPWTAFLMARIQFGLGMGNDFLGRGLFEIQEGGIPISIGVRRKW